MKAIHRFGGYMMAALLSLMIGTGCNPAKKVQKYSYLLDKNTPTTTPNTDSKSTPNAVASKPAPPANTPEVVKEARKYMGVPYKYGGTSKAGMDCSGLTSTAWAKAGVKLERSSKGQANQGEKISRQQLQPGDIAVFSAYNNGRIDHVGLVTQVSDDAVKFIHATVSKGVREDRLDEGYWKPRFLFGRRVSQDGSLGAND